MPLFCSDCPFQTSARKKTGHSVSGGLPGFMLESFENFYTRVELTKRAIRCDLRRLRRFFSDGFSK